MFITDEGMRHKLMRLSKAPVARNANALGPEEEVGDEEGPPPVPLLEVVAAEEEPPPLFPLLLSSPK